jgi:hypothetical protein
MFYSIHLSVVSQSCTIWEWRKGDKGIAGKVDIWWGVQGKERSRGNYR